MIGMQGEYVFFMTFVLENA